MVQSKAQTVDAWMAAVEPDRAGVLAEVRRLCRERLAGWEERMQWGMPGYGPAGADAVVSFNSQKQYVALYLGPTAIDRFADRLAGVDRGKGCLRLLVIALPIVADRRIAAGLGGYRTRRRLCKRYWRRQAQDQHTNEHSLHFVTPFVKPRCLRQNAAPPS